MISMTSLQLEIDGNLQCLSFRKCFQFKYKWNILDIRLYTITKGVPVKAKSAPVLQGLHFEWPKLVDNSYLPLYVFGGNICFWAKNYLEKVLEYP